MRTKTQARTRRQACSRLRVYLLPSLIVAIDSHYQSISCVIQWLLFSQLSNRPVFAEVLRRGGITNLTFSFIEPAKTAGRATPAPEIRDPGGTPYIKTEGTLGVNGRSAIEI